MAPKKKPSPSPQPILIGNCEVVVEAKNFKADSDDKTVQITLSKNVKVNISVVESKSGKICDDLHNNDNDGEFTGNLYFVLVNSKDADSQVELQDVLNHYITELPNMNYAANTGKQSTFLKRCVSNGKFCTLLMKSNSIDDSGKVLAAVTYQIVPADTQYAEIPLAAVSSACQRKGIGSLLYQELSKRLQSVGVRTIFCWGDTESEGFWIKQGFVSIGEVNNKGKARRLPIKANIRRALCFPGGSTLLVSHLSKDKPVNNEASLRLCHLRPTQNTLLPDTVQNHGLQEKREISTPNLRNQIEPIIELSQPQELVDNAPQLDGIQAIADLDNIDSGNSAAALGFTGAGADADASQCLCSSVGGKKRVWESSHTSLKSKKVKGGHQVDCPPDCKGFVPEADGKNNTEDKSPTQSKSITFLDARDSFTSNCSESTRMICQPVKCVSQDYGSNELLPRGSSFTIMLMNIADDAKKSNLSKIIEDLGGAVTSDGSLSTHIVTGKVRKTLNFCTALCSGAWIITPTWLKESFRKGKFVDETPFILKDEEYEMKYKIELKDAVQRARDRPRALLAGYKICLADHLQPPVHDLSAIVRSAGGDVMRGIGKVSEVSKTIFLACEEDMEEAMCAIEKGIRSFSSDWFMNCIMKQELDLDSPQFAESL